MSDVYDDREAFQSTKEIVAKLRSWYDGCLSVKEADVDEDTHRRRTKLAMKFPDEELVRQIVVDSVQLIRLHDINIKDLKW